MRSFLAAVQFLTVIPVRARLTEDDFARAPVWFPAVGLILGALAASADLAATHLGFSQVLSSIAGIAALAAFTGGLHLDGLADTADGFLSGRPRERTLEIMRDSRIGVMGALALIFVAAVKVGALCEIEGATRWKSLVLAALTGRCLQVVAMGSLPYARKDGGLATVFLSRNGAGRALWATLWMLVAALALAGLGSGAACVIGAGAMCVLLGAWSSRRIGGFTGDTLGATNECVEMIVLLVVSRC